jgi:hypothetical protein
MKKFIIGIVFIILTAGVVFAEGGQNQGSKGSGTTSTVQVHSHPKANRLPKWDSMMILMVSYSSNSCFCFQQLILSVHKYQ